MGLNFWGVTAIRSDGALVAKKVFKSWAILLACGPSHLNLTGPFTWVEGSDQPGRYSTLRYHKEEIGRKLGRLTSLCDKVLRSSGDICILHLGI